MSPAPTETATSTKYDNNGQYSRTGILRYEKVFGHGYISTGGPETTDVLCAKLGRASACSTSAAGSAGRRSTWRTATAPR